MLDVHVTDIAIVTVTVSAVVTLSDASDPGSVTDAVRQAIISYLDPMTWAYGTTIWRNELIALVDGVGGVDRVVSVTITGANGAGDYPLPTASTLPRATAASVTVSIGA
jgi:phage-related baseplate assembly protein